MDITVDLAKKLGGRRAADMPQFFHISAADYMVWIQREKTLFRDQLALTPELTGIPTIRKYFFDLPAQQNLTDYAYHINTIVPEYLEKLRRVVTQSDRDAGFLTIAEDFDRFSDAEVKDMLSATQEFSRSFSKEGMSKLKGDALLCKRQLEIKLKKNWFVFKGPTFNKILKSKGIVDRGSSKARGLENGCNWDKELAELLVPGFRKWYSHYCDEVTNLRAALRIHIDHVYNEAVVAMEKSLANIMVIDQVKRKWKPRRHKMRLQIENLMDEVESKAKRSLVWATMEDDRRNSLVSHITDARYEEVFAAVPKLKEGSNTNAKGKRYVMPKVKHQRNIMTEIFLGPKGCFVNDVTNYFQSDFDRKMDKLLDEHFAHIQKTLNEFSAMLREQAPINYTITSVGEEIRKELEDCMPKLQEDADALRTLLPKAIKPEDEAAIVLGDPTTNVGGTISGIYNSIRKRKRQNEGRSSKTRIKKEGGSSTKRTAYR